MADRSIALSTSTTSSSGVARRVRALAVASATVAALIVWLIAKPLLGITLTIPMTGGDQTMVVGWVSVLVISLVASLAAWGLLAVLERLTPHARTAWTAIAAAVLLLSFAGPFGAASNASAGTKVALALMHIAVATVLIPLLARTSPASRPVGNSQMMTRSTHERVH